MKRDENVFAKPVIKKLGITQRDKTSDHEKILSLFKQPSLFKVLLRKLVDLKDTVLEKNASDLLNRLLNVMVEGCKEDKLFYKTVTRLSKFIDEAELKPLYRSYAICMLHKWDCDYKFAIFVKSKFPDVFADDGEILTKYVKNKSMYGRLSKH